MSHILSLICFISFIFPGNKNTYMKSPKVSITIFKIRVTEGRISNPKRIHKWHPYAPDVNETCWTTRLPLEHSPSPKEKINSNTQTNKKTEAGLGNRHTSNIVTQQVITLMMKISTCKVTELEFEYSKNNLISQI